MVGGVCAHKYKFVETLTQPFRQTNQDHQPFCNSSCADDIVKSVAIRADLIGQLCYVEVGCYQILDDFVQSCFSFFQLLLSNVISWRV